jgi:hypothetical protein
MKAHFSHEGSENPYEKYDGAQDLDDNNLGPEKEAMEVKRLFAAGRPEVESSL